MKRGRVELAVNRAVRAGAFETRDGALVELARIYARALDADEEGQIPAWRAGIGLLGTLSEMGLTPKARAGVVKPATTSNPIDELRSRREARVGGS